MKIIKGTVYIGRMNCSHEDDYIVIELRDEQAHVIAAKAKIDLASFAKALTSQASECNIEFNDSGLVGKTREHKIEAVEVPGPVYGIPDAELKKHLAPFEVDGWIGRIADLKNPNRRHDGKNDVGFERWV